MFVVCSVFLLIDAQSDNVSNDIYLYRIYTVNGGLYIMAKQTIAATLHTSFMYCRLLQRT